jgi:hypothetical protein
MEQILSFTVDYTMGSVYAILGTVDEDGKVTSNRLVNLGHEGYDLLIEPNPEWAQGKPAGDFRKADIFTVMQIMGVE